MRILNIIATLVMLAAANVAVAQQSPMPTKGEKICMVTFGGVGSGTGANVGAVFTHMKNGRVVDATVTWGNGSDQLAMSYWKQGQPLSKIPLGFQNKVVIPGGGQPPDQPITLPSMTAGADYHYTPGKGAMNRDGQYSYRPYTLEQQGCQNGTG